MHILNMWEQMERELWREMYKWEEIILPVSISFMTTRHQHQIQLMYFPMEQDTLLMVVIHFLSDLRSLLELLILMEFLMFLSEQIMSMHTEIKSVELYMLK